ncbi:MAG: hypothetical protein RIS86_950 [Planctomycetota bacterium]|jgi:glutamate dehydrogenase (NAD(P)+)
MERSTVTRTHRSAASRIFEELAIAPQHGNLFHETARRMLHAAELVGLRHHQRLLLAEPRHESIVHVPVEMDDGHHRLFKGYRVLHSNALGPFLGGTRFSPRLSLDAAKGHAILASLRAALVRAPFGGAFGGVKVNPNELSQGELMRLVRRYTSVVSPQASAGRDVLAPEMGTDIRTMAWVYDTLAQQAGGHDPARSVVGRPGELGGLGPRGRAVATGLVAVLEELLGDSMLELRTARVAILGFGQVGAAVARQLAMHGARVTAVLSDGAALYDSSGIDVLALVAHRQRTGGIDGFEQATVVAERDFLEAPAEILVVCADDGALTAARAEACRARVVVEAGSANVSAEAEEVLLRQGVEVIPDVLVVGAADVANALEWRDVRNDPDFRKDAVESHIRRQLTLAARRVRVARTRHECDLRTAALCAALERLGRVHDLRGVFP